MGTRRSDWRRAIKCVRRAEGGMFDLGGSGKTEEQLQEERISRRGKGKVNVERKKLMKKGLRNS